MNNILQFDVPSACIEFQLSISPNARLSSQPILCQSKSRDNIITFKLENRNQECLPKGYLLAPINSEMMLQFYESNCQNLKISEETSSTVS